MSCHKKSNFKKCLKKEKKPCKKNFCLKLASPSKPIIGGPNGNEITVSMLDPQLFADPTIHIIQYTDPPVSNPSPSREVSGSVFPLVPSNNIKASQLTYVFTYPIGWEFGTIIYKYFSCYTSDRVKHVVDDRHIDAYFIGNKLFLHIHPDPQDDFILPGSDPNTSPPGLNIPRVVYITQ